MTLHKNVSGMENAAFGTKSLYVNTSGDHNTAVGTEALRGNTTGNENVAIGYQALEANTAGNKNIAIGYRAYASGYAYGNSAAIGANSQVSASNQIRLGDERVTSIGGKVSWSKVSDARFKLDVQADVPGLAFINALEPVSYVVDPQRIRHHLGQPVDADAVVPTEREVGFLAQDVERSAQRLGFAFSGVDRPESAQDAYGLRYAEFTVPLVQAVQELSKENDRLKAQIKTLEGDRARLSKLEQEVAELKTLLLMQAKAEE